MKTKKVLLLALLALVLLTALGGGIYWSQLPIPKESNPAVESIERFYRAYFRHYQADPLQKTKGPTPAFSSDFAAVSKKNVEACAATAVEGPCGWGANGDIYFDSQEYDPALSYENSRMKISELRPGEVTASFNVYPSDTKAGTHYDRTMVFKLVQAEGQWVVDDILIEGKSQRQEIEEETRALSKAPLLPGKLEKTK